MINVAFPPTSFNYSVTLSGCTRDVLVLVYTKNTTKDRHIYLCSLCREHACGACRYTNAEPQIRSVCTPSQEQCRESNCTSQSNRSVMWKTMHKGNLAVKRVRNHWEAYMCASRFSSWKWAQRSGSRSCWSRQNVANMLNSSKRKNKTYSII